MKSIRKFLQGFGLIPVSTTAIDTMGELEVISSTGVLQYHNGTVISPLITAASTDTLIGKTIDADLNTITNIENADIKAAAAIAVNKLAALTASRAVASDGSGFLTPSTTTATELGYVNGVTSAIQTQLNAKASTSLTSAHILVGNGSNVATDVAVSGDISIDNAGVATIASGVIVNADINASAAIDATKIANGSVSSTEFQYLDGVTSAIQTQLDAKGPAALTSAHLLVGSAGNVATDVAVTGDISLSNTGVTAYSGTVPINKGGTGQTTASAAFDALSPMTTVGDIIYGGASGVGTRLAAGTAGQILQSNGASAPTWVVPSSSIGATGLYAGHWAGSGSIYWAGNTNGSYTDPTTIGTPVLTQDYLFGFASVVTEATGLPGVTFTAPATGTLRIFMSGSGNNSSSGCDFKIETSTGTLIALMSACYGPAGTGFSTAGEGFLDVVATTVYTVKILFKLHGGAATYLGNLTSNDQMLSITMEYVK